MIEILVVIGIVAGIAAALPWIAPARLESIRARATARELVSFLQGVRLEAVTSQSSQTVEVDPSGKTLIWTTHHQSVTIPQSSRLQIVAPQTIPGPSTPNRLRFFADGSATGETLVLENSETEYRIGVDWLTGRAAVTR